MLVSENSAGRHRRSSKGRVRAIEYSRRAVTATETGVTGYAIYVGRVGALAVALGVGSAVASVPVAFADTTGSGGSTGSSADSPSTDASTSGPSTRATSPSRGTRSGSHAGTASEAPAADAPSAGRGASSDSADSSPATSATTPARNGTAPTTSGATTGDLGCRRRGTAPTRGRHCVPCGSGRDHQQR